MFNDIVSPESIRIIRIVLDVGLLSVLFYFLYRLFSVVRIPVLFNQIGLIVIAYIVAMLFKLETVLWILRNIFSWLIIGGIVVFQSELRALVMRMDFRYMFRKPKDVTTISDFKAITSAIQSLKEIKRGALIIFPRKVDLEHIIMSKVALNADLSAELLQTIFSHETALHDGAVIIQDNKITHAGCFLPTSREKNILLHLGSRHRAALGLSQTSDALVLVLSEEHRTISLVYDGKLLYDISIEHACSYVEQLLLGKPIEVDYNQIDNTTVLAETD